VEGRAQERAGGPFERGDDLVVVVEAGGVFARDDGFGAEDDRQRGPEPLAAWLAQSFAEWPEYLVDVSHPAAGAHGYVATVTLVREPGVHVDAHAGADQCLVRQHRLRECADQGCEPLCGVLVREAGDELLDRLDQGLNVGDVQEQ
jgi:hypothetical protein